MQLLLEQENPINYSGMKTQGVNPRMEAIYIILLLVGIKLSFHRSAERSR